MCRTLAIVVSVVLVVAVAVVTYSLAQAASAPPARGQEPAFKSEGYTLEFQRMKMDADVQFHPSQASNTSYSIELNGRTRVPKFLDVVAVSKRLYVRKAVDTDGNNMMAGAPIDPVKLLKSGGFSGIHDLAGDVEIDRLRLRSNPYRLKQITASAVFVIAQKRQSKVLPAVVMEEPVEVVDGLKIRISNLKRDRNRILVVNATYYRRNAGLKGPFLESVYAVDGEGKDLVGGRWDRGDPFSTKGTLTYSFALGKDQNHKSLRFAVVTEHKADGITFTIEDIFQK